MKPKLAMPNYNAPRLVKFCAFILLLAFAASCKKDGGSSFVLDASRKQIITNVYYGTDTAEKMDVYLPAGRGVSATKVFILLHPGSWTEGDKKDFDAAIDTLQVLLPDYAFFNVNYRLAHNGINIYPAAFNDVNLAMDYINSKAADYKVNAQKLILGGASAGAHLAMLTAYSQANASFKAVVDLFGPTDLTWLYNNHPFPQLARPILENFLGTTPSQNPVLYIQASPLGYVSASSPPTIIFQGAIDDVVPKELSIQLQQKLQAVGVVNQLVLYNGEGHGWVGANLTDTYLKIALFLKQHVN